MRFIVQLKLLTNLFNLTCKVFRRHYLLLNWSYFNIGWRTGYLFLNYIFWKQMVNLCEILLVANNKLTSYFLCLWFFPFSLVSWLGFCLFLNFLLRVIAKNYSLFDFFKRWEWVLRRSSMVIFRVMLGFRA